MIEKYTEMVVTCDICGDETVCRMSESDEIELLADLTNLGWYENKAGEHICPECSQEFGINGDYDDFS
jgi:ssDNA-binding Zn-finger/Zn-ribbon topoisomerase 1